jgi:hypothetical protein
MTGFTAWRRTIAVFDGIAKEIFCARPTAKQIRLRARGSRRIVTRMTQRTIDQRATQPLAAAFFAALRCTAKDAMGEINVGIVHRKFDDCFPSGLGNKLFLFAARLPRSCQSAFT